LLSIIETYSSLAEILPDLWPDPFILDFFDEYPLLQYASTFWSDHLRRAATENSPTPEWTLTKQLFAPVSHTTFFRICEATAEEYDVPIAYYAGFYRSIPPWPSEFELDNRLYHPSFLGITELVKWLLHDKEGGIRTTN